MNERLVSSPVNVQGFALFELAGMEVTEVSLLLNSSSQIEGISKDDDISGHFELWLGIAIAACLALCIVMTVIGNVLVLTAFIVNRTLRVPSNYFVASLAVTDILIGTVSMPIFTVYTIRGSWDFGPLLCDLWLSLDYSICLVSQYTILLITVDRFSSVKFPIEHKIWQTRSRIACFIGLTWIAPIVVFSVRIFGWDRLVEADDHTKTGHCTARFLYAPVFNVSLAVGHFTKTLIVIILYSIMYNVASDAQKKRAVKCGPLIAEQKRKIAVKTKISSILGAFIICWTPYHVLALVETFCSHPPCSNKQLFMFSYFLCYINSTLNPFCYALANHQFKSTFMRFFKGDFYRN